MTHDSTTPATETTPAFTVTVLNASGDEVTFLSLSVRIPETAAPLVLNDEGKEVRDHGNADWPTDEEIVAEVRRLTGRDVVLGAYGDGDDLLEVTYCATDRETPETIADRVGREWGVEMISHRCYPDGIDDEDEAARDLENCAFDVLRDEMRAAGYADPTERDDWRSLVSASCRAAVAYVVEMMADDAEDEDDGQPSELQENEDFAHDNDF